MKEDFEVTPWEATGEINYQYLIKKFGVIPIDKNLLDMISKAFGEVPYLIRRGIFFSHRDLDKVIEDYLDGKKPFLYAGRAPSGSMHIGHAIPLIFTKLLQKKFNTFVFSQFTADEKFLYNPQLTPFKVYNFTSIQAAPTF